MKTVCQVMLQTVNEVKDFVNAVNQCAYDVDLLSGRYVIDAKSLMGIFSLDLTKPIDLATDPENADDLLSKIGFCVYKG